ncbi:MAG: hypothetical protein ACQESG_06810 [Nanobdellota archaeon]
MKFIVLFFALLLILWGCTTDDQVREEIETANYCETTDECVNLGSHCPFGCYVLVNEAESDRIQGLLDSYSGPECVYGCVRCNVSCINKSCQTVC